MSTQDKVAIVTGAAQGIGKSIATWLLSHDYQVFIFDVNPIVGNETEKELQNVYGKTKVSFTQCNVADKGSFTDAFNQTLKKCDHISLMVNNAGIVEEHDFEKCIAVNLCGVILGSNLAIANMRKDRGGKGGTIVNVASVAAVTSFYHVPSYCATKSGVLNFTRSWSANPKCAELGLTFMCICPGVVDTQLIAEGASKSLDPSYFKSLQNEYGLLKLEDFKKGFGKLLTDNQNGSVIEVSLDKTEYMIHPTAGGVTQNASS